MTKRFARWARAEGIGDEALCGAAREIAAGVFDADLGGYLFKKRIARKGAGKSGGYRTILGYRKGKSERVIFLYGFAKSERANLDDREREALKIVAEAFITASTEKIAQLIRNSSVVILECEEQ